MKGLLKFITCGSVDDGKSTLIGHILYDSKLLYTDQEESLKLDSKVGSREGAIDYSLLLDGLTEEREQGITIDVAYRYFTTDARSFIVADTPGHEEYTRNMAVGASFASLAVILVDASQGVLIQTKRHARICALMGIRHFIFAVNKMDLIHYDYDAFKALAKDIEALKEELSLANVTIIPVSATVGDNITKKSTNMPWYTGDTILHVLENVDIDDAKNEEGFVLPVQRVCRPNHSYRGFQGQIESGTLHIGDEVESLPSGEKAHVKNIFLGDKDVKFAPVGSPVTVSLDREVDVSRGCVLTNKTSLHVSSGVIAQILWMDDVKLTEGKPFFVKIGTKLIPGSVKKILYKTDINTGEKQETHTLSKNEIATVEISFADRVIVDYFSRHATLGELILIDRITNATSACGVVEKITDHNNLDTTLSAEKRATSKSQIAKTFLFKLDEDKINLKFVERVEQSLFIEGRHTYLYKPENTDDATTVVRHLNDAGIIVLLVLDEFAASITDLTGISIETFDTDVITVSSIAQNIKDKTSLSYGINQHYVI